METDFALGEGLLESLRELASKNEPQHVLRQEEAVARIDVHPAAMIERHFVRTADLAGIADALSIRR